MCHLASIRPFTAVKSIFYISQVNGNWNHKFVARACLQHFALFFNFFCTFRWKKLHILGFAVAARWQCHTEPLEVLNKRPSLALFVFSCWWLLRSIRYKYLFFHISMYVYIICVDVFVGWVFLAFSAAWQHISSVDKWSPAQLEHVRVWVLVRVFIHQPTFMNIN